MSKYLQSLLRPVELYSMIKWKLTKDPSAIPESAKSKNLRWCWKMLNHTSRSFAFVIRELGDELRDPVCLFYLVLRALDTIEDDMTSLPVATKIQMLESFHEKLYVTGWSFNGCGEGYEKTLLSEYDRVIDAFLDLDEGYQEVIRDICQRMGEGMAEFVNREVVTVTDWNLYCHYVAGLVGIGLSKLFAHSGLEDDSFNQLDQLSNSMGLCLQKTNIIRDYHEDIISTRIFWPREIWSKHSVKLEDFLKEEKEQQSLDCLNELITSAIQHLPDCLTYMRKLRDSGNFNFCAIPQIMAIGTLATCYNNREVFRGVVKMRRGESASIMMDISGMDSLYKYFHYYANIMLAKVPNDGSESSELARSTLQQLIDECQPHVDQMLSIWSGTDYLAAGTFIVSGAYLLQSKVLRSRL